eukprot:14885904-Alexandrium_andersonii.AAC.1
MFAFEGPKPGSEGGVGEGGGMEGIHYPNNSVLGRPNPASEFVRFRSGGFLDNRKSAKAAGFG